MTFQLKNGDPGYEDLYRLLTGKPKVKPEQLGKPISLLEKGLPGAPEQASPPLLEIPERKTDFMRIIEVLLLPARNPFFTGREPVLAQLQEALAVRGRAALSGLGGVGKTQAAVEYAHRHLDEYVYTFWATAHSQAEPLCERALAIREKARGAEHPDVATSLENYAILLRNIDLPEDAALLESRARAIRAKR
jgi:Tetratricopeptide repeat